MTVPLSADAKPPDKGSSELDPIAKGVSQGGGGYVKGLVNDVDDLEMCCYADIDRMIA